MTDDPTQQPHEDSTILDVIRDVFTRFPVFAATYLTSPGPPAFFIVVWLIGMDSVAGGLELENLQQGHYTVDNWFGAWVRIMSLGVLVGILRYWIVGSLFYLVARIARGQGLPRTGRYAFLYAVLPVAVVNLAVKVIQMLVYGNDFFTGASHPAFDVVVSVAMLATYVYSAVLCYIAMRMLLGTERVRTIALLGVVTVALMAAAVGLL